MNFSIATEKNGVQILEGLPPKKNTLQLLNNEDKFLADVEESDGDISPGDDEPEDDSVDGSDDEEELVINFVNTIPQSNMAIPDGEMAPTRRQIDMVA